MNSIELAKAGLCECCQLELHHGKWTDAEIAECCEDLGISEDEFGDTCDDCFVAQVGRGDVEYAQRLMGRPLQLRSA